MVSKLTETETVIKRILPYLRRRGYEPEVDLDFETALKTTERYSMGYCDILATLGKARPSFLIEAKRAGKKLTNKDRDQALDYGRSVKVPFVIVTNGTEIRAYNARSGAPLKWNGRLADRIPSKAQLGSALTYLKATPDADNVTIGSDSSLPFRPALPLKQLNALFARCHNAIRKIEKDEEHHLRIFRSSSSSSSWKKRMISVISRYHTLTDFMT